MPHDLVQPPAMQVRTPTREFPAMRGGWRDPLPPHPPPSPQPPPPPPPHTHSLRSQALLLEELRLCNLFECGMSIAAVERLRELSEAELAAAATAEGVVALVHAAAELSAPQLVRFCLQMISDNFDTLRASGALDSLRTPLTAEVLLLHSTAPLQEALKLRRVDAMALLLARTDALPPATPASLVATLDCEGRTALETALRLDDWSHQLRSSKRARLWTRWPAAATRRSCTSSPPATRSAQPSSSPLLARRLSSSSATAPPSTRRMAAASLLSTSHSSGLHRPSFRSAPRRTFHTADTPDMQR